MKKITVVANNIESLGQSVNDDLVRLRNQVTLTSQFDQTLKTAQVVVWLAENPRVDDQVFDLIGLLDQRAKVPEKIVMLSIAGVNDEVDTKKLSSWYGDEYGDLILSYQYAIKMIDELEIPYTIVRAAPQTNDSTSVKVSNEGSPLQGDLVNVDSLATIIANACSIDQYTNQSIGVSDI